MAYIPIRVVPRTENSERIDLAKVLLEPNQKLNELSMNKNADRDSLQTTGDIYESFKCR